MFFIVGADAQQYGPSSVEEVREWIQQGRADRNTLARREGETNWQPLGSFPEFASVLVQQMEPLLPPKVKTLQEIFSRPPDFNIGECFSHAGTLLAANLGTLIGAAFLVGILDALVGVIPFIGAMTQGVLYGGLALVYLRRIRGLEASPFMVFAGFGGGFMQLALAGLLTSFLAGMGACAFYLPYVYLKVAWMLTLPLIVDKGFEFWTAMEVCRKVTTRVWFKMFFLIVVVYSPFILAQFYFLFHMMDLLQAKVVPIFPEDLTLFLKDSSSYLQKAAPLLDEVSKAMSPTLRLTQLVWLVNLPFGTSVLMYAYEALFNPGKTKTPQ